MVPAYARSKTVKLPRWDSVFALLVIVGSGVRKRHFRDRRYSWEPNLIRSWINVGKGVGKGLSTSSGIPRSYYVEVRYHLASQTPPAD
jgi:hypothetical protein